MQALTQAFFFFYTFFKQHTHCTARSIQEHRTHRVLLRALPLLLLLPAPAAGVHLFAGRLAGQQAVQLLPPYLSGRWQLQLQTIRQVPQSANAVLHNLMAGAEGGQAFGRGVTVESV